MPTSTLTLTGIADAIGVPVARWSHQCHSISLQIVRSGIVTGRVARGTCRGVGSQHSWVVLGNDCYDPDAPLLDATLWSYQGRNPYLWTGTYHDSLHRPHGHGSIWDWGCPAAGDGPSIQLTPRKKLSADARGFLSIIGPLDRQGWAVLAANAPVIGWPAAEILAAMDDTPGLSTLVPIDRLGMLTDRNPQGLYLP